MDQNDENNNVNNDNVLPPQLQLTDQERAWTIQLMGTMRGPEGVRAGITSLPSQFEYAIYALATGGDHDLAIKKASAMQRFRETYNIQDTIDEAVAALQEFIRLQPQVALHVDASSAQGGVLAFDQSKFHPKIAMESDSNWRIHVRFFYYLGRVFSTNFDVLRKGIHFLIEGSDFSWDNIDIQFEEQMWAELWDHEPHHYQEVRIYNTNSLANVFWSLCKPFLTNDFLKSIRMGCQIEIVDLIFPNATPSLAAMLHGLFNGSPKLKLSDLYIQPTYDEAMQNFLKIFKARLEERHHNDQIFRL